YIHATFGGDMIKKTVVEWTFTPRGFFEADQKTIDVCDCKITIKPGSAEAILLPPTTLTAQRLHELLQEEFYIQKITVGTSFSLEGPSVTTIMSDGTKSHDLNVQNVRLKIIPYPVTIVSSEEELKE